MSAAAHRKQYWIIFGWLVVLTGLEVAIVYLPVAKPLMISALIGMAVAKAALVAYFYMHLKSETQLLRRTVAYCMAIPAVYAIVLIGEATWRMLA